MLVSTGIWLLGILIAMTVIFPSLTPGKVMTAVGLGSIAIGFAFKDIFENFSAGILAFARCLLIVGARLHLQLVVEKRPDVFRADDLVELLHVGLEEDEPAEKPIGMAALLVDFLAHACSEPGSPSQSKIDDRVP